MQKTTFSIPKMDCAAEERLVRMAVEGTVTIRRVGADLSAGALTFTTRVRPSTCFAYWRR